MATKYPASIDDLLSLPKVFDGISPILADDVNRIRDAVVAIESEIGTNPSGSFGTIKDRLETLRDGYFAQNIVVVDIDGYWATDNVEFVLAEVGAELESIRNDLANLTASQVAVEDIAGNFAATDVEGALAELATIVSSNVIGPAEDGDYTDGLFTDFTPTTPVGTPVDRFNEVLKELAPSPAPALGDIGYSTALGVSGNVSFGASNAIATYSDVGTDGGGAALDISDNFTSASGTALRKGIYAASVVKAGTVADGVAADSGTPTPSYPANAFGDGYDGYLQLEVNGSVVHTVDLQVFGSGSSVNANGSGFTSISLPTNNQFPNGNDFTLFFYRTADWTVAAADQRNGWNYARVLHNNSPTFLRSTNYFEWVQDADVTATSFSGEALSGLSMAGSKFLSGVEYHTSGSATYDITVNNLHRNTYSDSASAISHGSSTNLTISSSALAAITNEANTEVLNKSATVSGTRILNGSLTGTTTVDRTVQSDITSIGASISGILLDTVAENATATNEPLNGEDYRVPSNRSLTDTTGFTMGGAGLWDSTISLVSATAGYTNGLLLYNGQLFYPNDASVANLGNFGGITNGPGGNPDYSSASGTRVYWRYFYFGSATSNFVLNLNATGTTVVNAGSVTASTGEISVEFLLPNTTVDGGATVEFKDANIAFTTDTAIGCYAATFGANVGNTSGSDWGISFGTKNTATAGNAVIIRITAGDGWTGDIQNITFAAA